MKSDFGIITFLSLKTAPILISSGKFEFFNSLIFNSDGSEAEMCGNGIRCLSRYIVDYNEEYRNN